MAHCKMGVAYLHQPIKEPGVECLGECISGVGSLLHVEFHLDGLRLPTPLALHHPARQLVLQTPRVHPQQERRELQDWREQPHPQCHTHLRGSCHASTPNRNAGNCMSNWREQPHPPCHTHLRGSCHTSTPQYIRNAGLERVTLVRPHPPCHTHLEAAATTPFPTGTQGIAWSHPLKGTPL